LKSTVKNQFLTSKFACCGGSRGVLFCTRAKFVFISKFTLRAVFEKSTKFRMKLHILRKTRQTRICYTLQKTSGTWVHITNSFFVPHTSKKSNLPTLTSSQAFCSFFRFLAGASVLQTTNGCTSQLFSEIA
jgi:hypothetical protein